MRVCVKRREVIRSRDPFSILKLHLFWYIPFFKNFQNQKKRTNRNKAKGIFNLDSMELLGPSEPPPPSELIHKIQVKRKEMSKNAVLPSFSGAWLNFYCKCGGMPTAHSRLAKWLSLGRPHDCQNGCGKPWGNMDNSSYRSRP